MALLLRPFTVSLEGQSHIVKIESDAKSILIRVESIVSWYPFFVWDVQIPKIHDHSGKMTTNSTICDYLCEILRTIVRFSHERSYRQFAQFTSCPIVFRRTHSASASSETIKGARGDGGSIQKKNDKKRVVTLICLV